MTMKMQLTGLNELVKRLRELPLEMRAKTLRGAVSTAAEIVRAEAILRAPVYTGSVQKGHPPPGTLKKEIFKARYPEECNDTREVWQVNVKRRYGAYYAHMVEYGTVKMPPQPFMRPAWDAKRQAALDAMGTYLAYSLPDLTGRR